MGGAAFFIFIRILFNFIRLRVRTIWFKWRDWWVENNAVWPQLQTTPCNSFVRILRFAGYRRAIPRTQVLLGIAVVSLCLVSIAGLQFLGYTLGGVLCIWWFLKKRARATQHKIIAQIPEALTSIAESLRAGFSFSQAVSFVSRELPNPIAPIFCSVARGIERGLSTVDSFNSVSRQLELRVFTDTVICINAGLRSGGNIVPLLYNQANTLQAERTSEREIQNLTAAGRSSGLIIALLAPVVFLFFWFCSPSYTHIFLDTLIGNILFGISILLEALGFIWIQKIVRRT